MKDKVVFITGGNSGIGLATALKFAEHGSHVAIVGRRQEENQKAVAAIEQHGVKALAFSADVTDRAALGAAVKGTVKQLGRIDVAFNNAGVEQAPKPLTDQTDDEYRHVIDVNVQGVWLAMQLEIPHLLNSGGGAIINTSSVLGHVGIAQVPLYVASKFAVEGLTKSVALEYAGQGIRINSVSPGVVETDLYQRFTDGNADMQAAMAQMHPIGRTGRPEEIASGVYWLAAEATWTTGQALILDGGFTAR